MSVVRDKRWLRGYCRAHHIAIAKGFRVLARRWGKPAQATCKAAQKHANLVQTGFMDTRTRLAIEPFRHRLWRIARAELGTKEWPPSSNWGEVAKYLKAAGIGGSSPWCAAFVTYCVNKAGWKRSVPSQRGWVPAWETWGRGSGYAVAKLKARRGDIVTFDWDGDNVGNHIGFISRDYGPLKQVATLEGNATSGAIPGGGVVRKTRFWSQVNVVIRLPNW
jgi:hypothetical protein